MINKLSFSRYKPFSINGTQITIPFIQLDQKVTDKQVVWKSGIDRMDKLSNNYYSGDPRNGWLIMLANPEYTFEFDIPNNTIITIPYPLQETLNEYNEKANNFSKNN